MVLMTGYFGYDWWYEKRTVDDVEREHVKKLIEGEEGDYKTRKLRKYIDHRVRMNIV
jgi:hypothetical protein